MIFGKRLHQLGSCAHALTGNIQKRMATQERMTTNNGKYLCLEKKAHFHMSLTAQTQYHDGGHSFAQLDNGACMLNHNNNIQ